MSTYWRVAGLITGSSILHSERSLGKTLPPDSCVFALGEM